MEAIEWILNQGRLAEIGLVVILAVVGLVLVKVIVSVAARVIVMVVCLAAMATGLYLFQGLRERRAHVQFEIVAEARPARIKGNTFKPIRGQKCTLTIKGRYLKPKDLAEKDFGRAYVEAECKARLQCGDKYTQEFTDEQARCLFMLAKGFVRYECDPCRGSPDLRVMPFKNRAHLRDRAAKPDGRASFKLKFTKTKPHK